MKARYDKKEDILMIELKREKIDDAYETDNAIVHINSNKEPVLLEIFNAGTGYDSKEDAFYVKLSRGRYNHTRKITESVLIDEDKNGKVLGVEILEARKNIRTFNPQESNVTLQPI